MKINLGTMYYEGTEKDLTNLVQFCLENDIHKFDTASNYTTQKLLGFALSSLSRDDFFLSTKVFIPHDEHIANGVTPSLAKSHVDQSIELSLKKLKVDYFDLVYMHRYDDKVEIDDLVSTLLPYLGKEVRAIGTSCWPNEKVKLFNEKLVDKGFIKGVSAVQNPYNLFNRKPETYLGELKANDIYLVGYSPLARGELTGKYVFDLDKSGRFYRDNLKETMIYHTEENKILLKTIVKNLKLSNSNQLLGYVFYAYKQLIKEMEIVCGVRENSQIETIIEAMNVKVDEDSIEKFIKYFDTYLSNGI